MMVFREKTITRMNRLHIGNLRGADDARDIEIALGRRGVADADGLIGQLQIAGILVGSGINDGRLHTHLAAGANDA
jgi:hypothetical protein